MKLIIVHIIYSDFFSPLNFQSFLEKKFFLCYIKALSKRGELKTIKAKRRFNVGEKERREKKIYYHEKEDGIFSSYTIYDFHGFVFPRMGERRDIGAFNPEDIVKFLKRIKESVYEEMKARCAVQPKLFNILSEELPSRFGGNFSACWLKDKTAGSKRDRKYRCSEIFMEPDLLKDFEKNKHIPNVAFTFGKIDAVTILQVPHSYWSSIFRSFMLTQRVIEEKKNEPFDIINLPSHRVKYGCVTDDPKKKCGAPCGTPEEELYNYSFDKPYVAFTLVQFPKTLIKHCDHPKCHIGDSPCLRKNHLIRFCKTLLASKEDKQLNKREQQSDSGDNPRIELFLTFSGHYQAIIKSEFKSIDEINMFLDKIKSFEADFLVDEIATIVGLNGKHFLDGKKGKQIFDTSSSSGEFAFAILIKTKGTSDFLSSEKMDKKGEKSEKKTEFSLDYDICKELKGVLSKYISDDKNMVIYMRPFFWDILVTIKTSEIYKFVMSVIKDIRDIPNVVHAITIPLWEFEEYNNKREHIKKIKEKSGEKATITKLTECPAWSDRRKQIFASQSNLGEEILKEWKKFKAIVPKDIFKQSEGMLNPLSNRIYNQKFDLELIFAYLLQLEAGWTTHLLTYPLRTFELMLRSLRNIYKELVELTKEMKKVEQQKATDKKEVWEKLSEIVSEISTLKEIITNLITEYNDKQEGSQISWMTAPYLRIGQRAGVIDMYTDALNDLFKDYCGKFLGKIDLWKGLVTPSSGQDFSVVPVYQVLHLPVDIKFHVHGRLPLMAHEAAHFILWCLLKAPDSSYFIREDELKKNKNFSKKKALDDKLLEKRKFFIIKIWNEMFERAKREAQYVLKDEKYEVEYEKGKKVEIKRVDMVLGSLNIVRDKEPDALEFLVDVLAGLIAGPAYFKSFGLLYYQSRESTIQRPRTIVPTYYPKSDWIRVYLGILLWQRISRKEKNGMDWLDDYWELPSYFSEVLATVDTELVEEDNDNKYRDYLSEKIAPESIKVRKLDFYMDYNTYLIRAFFARKRGPCLLDRFVRFFEDIFDKNLFFFGGHGGVRFKSNTAKDVQKDCIEVSERCCQYASQLVFESRIILEGRLKDISASSIMSPIQRPVVPSGRILHSLYYGTGRAPQGGKHEQSPG
jgi:hypothetical protein